MMKLGREISQLMAIGLSLSTTLVLTNCSGVKFSNMSAAGNSLATGGTIAGISPGTGSGGGTTPPGLGGTTPISGGTCTVTNLLVPVKVLFVVDRSGSNAVYTQDEGTEECTSLNNVGCAPPTDPNLTFRSGSITDFFNQYSSNSAFSWGFLAFSGTSAQSYISNGGTASFGNAAMMQSAINEFNSNGDQDATPYLAALSAAQTAISQDPGLKLKGSQAPLYEIIFLSDGYPTDAVNNDGSVDMASLSSTITAISNMAPGRVFLSSVYYGTINDPTAAATLQTMAQTGHGQFVNADTSNTSTISINNLITVPTGDCSN